LSENATDKTSPEISGIEELAGGIMLLTYSLASALIMGSYSNTYSPVAVAAFAVLVLFTPFGAHLFATGFAKILKSARS
jgi:hypothetical protein